MKKIINLLIVCFFYTAIQAQNFEDIVRFSKTTSTGTARSAAMGGAFNALGGDISSITNNPAALGVFRKSEVSFTPLIHVNKTKSEQKNIQKNSFQMGDLGTVITFYSPAFNWKGINIGFNYTNLNNFNKKTKQIIETSPTSFLDIMAYQASMSNELDGSSLSGMAYDCFLINPSADSSYYTSVLFANEAVAQVKEIEESGYQGEYTISLGTNYKDQLYIGMSIGIQSLYYKMKSIYQEAPGLESPSGLDYYTFEEFIKMNGVGTNLKFGFIYRPIPEFRIGASIHTPTWYSMNYSTYSGFYSSFWQTDPTLGREDFEYAAYNPTFDFNFDMRTPWRAIVGLGTVLGSKAIISADYEFIKYTNAQFQNASDGYDYRETNNNIQTYLRPTHNFRAGAEYRFNSIASLRTGYSFLDSPYYETEKSHNRQQSFSGGFGLNFGSLYCDAAYVHKYSKNTTVFYSTGDPQVDITATPIKNKYRDNEIRFTIGLRF